MKHARRPFLLVLPLVLVASAAAAQLAFEDVIRNLRNPDPRIRMDSLTVLRDARYPEAIVPVAALVNDEIDDIQLQAIATELSFFLVDDVPAKRRVGFLLEVRTEARAATAFDAGPLAAWPVPAPRELVEALLMAVDDDHQRVRVEAIYTLGVVASPPVAAPIADGLIKALDHYDPAIRVAAARVVGRLRVKSAGDALIAAMNDSRADVRFAAMRALGAIGEVRAIQALSDAFTYYGKGEGAWSALEALARIGHASSAPLFRAQLPAKDEKLRRAAAEGLARIADPTELPAMQLAANTDESPRVRAALVFALYKLGHNYLDRLIEFLASERTATQVQLYLLELGPGVVAGLASRLQDPDEAIRERLADVLGAMGDPVAVPLLNTLTQDRSRRVARSATNAIARLEMTSGAARVASSR